MRVRKILWKGFKRSLVLGIGVLGLLLLCHYVVSRATRHQLYNQVDQVPYCRVGLLLGTSPKLTNAQANPYFENRMDACAELLNARRIKYIIVSGDNKEKNYNEPAAMRKALMQRGIPDSVIYQDYAGFRTFDSVVRARQVFGQDSILIISQRFHNERALYIANWYKIKAVAFNAQDVGTYQGLKTQVREYFARVNMFVDFIIDKQPELLGDLIEVGNHQE